MSAGRLTWWGTNIFTSVQAGKDQLSAGGWGGLSSPHQQLLDNCWDQLTTCPLYSVLCTLYSPLYTLYSVPLSRGLVLVMVSDVGVVVMAQAGCRLVPPSWPLQTRYKIGFPAHWRPVQCQWLASPAGRSRPPSCPQAGHCHLAACTVKVDEVVNLPIQSSKLTWLETKKK